VSDVSADVGVCLRAVKTMLIKIHVLSAKWNVATKVSSVWTVFQLLITSQAGWSSEQAAPQYTFSKMGSYHLYRISLIFLHTSANCLIGLSISSSLGSQKACRISNQLATAIVLHSHRTFLRPMPDVWLSLCIKFVPYMNHAFSLAIELATSLRGTRTRARTNECDMTA